MQKKLNDKKHVPPLSWLPHGLLSHGSPLPTPLHHIQGKQYWTIRGDMVRLGGSCPSTMRTLRGVLRGWLSLPWARLGQESSVAVASLYPPPAPTAVGTSN